MLVGLTVGFRRCITAILGVAVGSRKGPAVELVAGVAVGISADRVEEAISAGLDSFG